MSDPRNTNEAKALAQAMVEIARMIALATADNRDDPAPAPEVVPV